MKKLLRLFTMLFIHHPDEYYQDAAQSAGLKYQEFNSADIAFFKAQMKSVEADAMIYIAFKSPKTTIKDCKELFDKLK